MKPADDPLAPTARPDVSGRIVRARLLARMTELLAPVSRRVLWMSGAAGSGKSTLASQFQSALQGEAHIWCCLDDSARDPAVFAQRLGEARAQLGPSAWEWPALTQEHLARPGQVLRQRARFLFASLPEAATVVVDDVDVLDSAATEWLALLSAEVRAGQKLLLLSKCELPVALLGLFADGRLARLEGAELAFDADETRRWLQSRGQDASRSSWLQQRSEGWPFAAALLTETDGEALLERWVEQRVWPKLRSLDAATLALCAWMPGLAAQDLSDAAAARLESMARSGLFVDRCGVAPALHYKLHAVLRHFLQSRQRASQDAVHLAATLQQIVLRLEAHGDIDVALGLLLEAAALDPVHTPRVEALLCQVAPAWLAQCRHASLREAAASVPAAQRSGKLWAWLAQAELPRSPAAARDCADRAIALLPARDAALAAQCHALAIATHFQSFDDTRPLAARVAALQALEIGADDPAKLPPERATIAVAVWSALFLRQPTHPSCPAWHARVRALLHEPANPNLKIRAAMLLAKDAWYSGRHAELLQLPALVRANLELPGVTPYSRLVWGLLCQYGAWASADWPAGLAATEEALSAAADSGIDLLDRHLRLHGACFAHLAGDAARSQCWLDEVGAAADPTRRMEAWHHFCVRGWLALCAGGPAAAESASRLAIDAAQAMGPSPHAMAMAVRCQALQELGDTETLRNARAELEGLAQATENRLAQWHVLLLDGRTALDHGDRAGALQRLSRALALARSQGLWAPIGSEPRALARLLALALDAGIEAETATRICRSLRLQAPPDAGAAWPWTVRVHTLGRFAIEVDGQPLAMNGKQQKRPLDLLQALIALGGEAPATRLADLLWPEGQGDLALGALEAALRRLRRMLGPADVLRLSGGVLSLDRQRVWVDALASPGAATADFLPAQEAAWADEARRRASRRIAALP